MKVAIVGSRDFTDYGVFLSNMSKLNLSNITEIVSGGARGADSLASRYASENNIKLTEFLPDWDRYGKSAGFIRNEEIIKASDFVVAFWDGMSKGTYSDIQICWKLHKDFVIFYTK